MTPRLALDDAALRLARILRAENDALAANDAPAAAALLPEKLAATEALRAALPGATPNPATAAALRDLAAENAARLTQAIAVQARILEMVARAARQSTPARYGALGGLAPATGAMALTVRA